MIPVVPVQALFVVLVGELVHVIVDLEPGTINDDCLDFCHDIQFRSGQRDIGLIVLEDLSESFRIDVSPVINEDSVAHVLSLAHVERSCEVVDIIHRFGIRIDEDILICFCGMSRDTGKVVGSLHELQLVGDTAKSDCQVEDFGTFVGRGSIRDIGRIEFTIKDRSDEHVLHDQELIVVRRGIQFLDDLLDEVVHAVPRQERKFEVLLLDRGLVELFVVLDVERGTDVRHFTFVDLMLSYGGIILEGFRQIDEDLFDGLTIFKVTLLEHRPGIGVHFGLDNDFTDPVDEGFQEFILECRIVHDDRTDLADGLRVRSSDRDMVFKVKGCFVTDGIDDINRSIGSGNDFRSTRHCKIPPFLIHRYSSEGFLGSGSSSKRSSMRMSSLSASCSSSISSALESALTRPPLKNRSLYLLLHASLVSFSCCSNSATLASLPVSSNAA